MSTDPEIMPGQEAGIDNNALRDYQFRHDRTLW